MKRLAVVVFATLAVPATAVNNAVFFQSVPTLDEFGLGLLIALVAGVAGWAVRRRSRK
jgi:hypothetical protein